MSAAASFDPESAAAQHSSRSFGQTYQEKVAHYVNSPFSAVIMTIFTVYCLYSEDLKQIAFDPVCAGDACSSFGGEDPAFAVVSLVAFCIFLIEVLLNCYW